MVTEIELFDSTDTKALWVVINGEKLVTVGFILMFNWQTFYMEMKSFLLTYLFHGAESFSRS
jgi:hypothetical protein